MRRLSDALVVTCEHGGSHVPSPWRHLFAGRERLLASHRGFDRGALDLARALARSARAPLVASRVTRLLVDLNRSIGNEALFSRIVRESKADRDAILEACYSPHRAAVSRAVGAAVARHGRVLHVAAHTFTPVLRGLRRRADVGLLFDPARRRERAFAERWRREIAAFEPELRVRMNYPYRGTSDGLATALRRSHRDARYAGIEIEVNQRFPRRDGAAWARLRKVLASSLRRALG